MAIKKTTGTKKTASKGKAVDRINVRYNGTYLGNITLWDDSQQDTKAMFELLKEGHNLGGLEACIPKSENVEDAKAALLAKYG